MSSALLLLDQKELVTLLLYLGHILTTFTLTQKIQTECFSKTLVTSHYTEHCHCQKDNFDLLNNCKLVNKDSSSSIYHDPCSNFTYQEHHLLGRLLLTYCILFVPCIVTIITRIHHQLHTSSSIDSTTLGGSWSVQQFYSTPLYPPLSLSHQ